MTEQDITPSTAPKQMASEIKIPSTPDRTHRSSSTSSNATKKDEPIIPSTPPLGGSGRKFSGGNFQSPGDLSSAGLPPATPSMNSGRYKLSNVLETPYSAKSTNDANTSPLKSPSDYQDNEPESDKPPIRQISSTLKARLSYAFVKYQHGWANQSLDELEKTVINRDSDLAEPFKEFTSPGKSQSKTYEDFWSNSNRSPRKGLSPSKVTKPTNNLLRSPTKVNIDNQRAEDDGSANLAFLQAISKSRSPKRRSQLQNNLRIDASKFSQQNPEAEAIESLMSLSSPQSFKPKLDLSHQQNLPRQRLSFGEHLSPQNSKHTSPYKANENAVETESDTEYEQSNTTDEEDVSTQSQSNNDTKTENDDDVDIRTNSDKDSKSPI